MTSSKWLWVSFLLVSLLPRALGVGTFIAAPNRVDMVHDGARDVLYITAGGEVLRYGLSANAFLTPFALGGNLAGMDLSPDGNTLVVADQAVAEGSNRVHVIDLPTGAVRRAAFPLAAGEGGTWGVAFGNDGAVLVTSKAGGTGRGPLRRFHPLTGDTLTVATIGDASMVCASGDRATIAVAEGGSILGLVERYGVSTRKLLQSTYAGWINYEAGLNRDGTQLATPTVGGTFFYNLDGAKLVMTNHLGIFNSLHPLGVVYHPRADAVFLSWLGTTEVVACHSVTWAELGRFDLESPSGNPGAQAFVQGRLKTSADGALIFATVEGGIRYFPHQLVIPVIGLNHRLVIASDPPNLGAPFPLSFGTNWIQGEADPLVSNQVAPIVESNGTRFTCGGWTGTGSVPAVGHSNVVTFTLTSVSTLTWRWTTNAHQLSVGTEGAGTLNASNGWIAVNTTVQLLASPAPQYRFDHWMGDLMTNPADANPIVITMDRPRSLTAVFVSDTLPLVVACNPENAGSPGDFAFGTNYVIRGTVVTSSVPAVVEMNGVRYGCAGWSGSGDVPAVGSSTQVVFRVTAPSSLTWNWTPADYQLLVATDGPGSVNLASDWYPAGKLLSLLATADASFRFDHWAGDVPPDIALSNPFFLPMDQPRTVTAFFVPDELPLVIQGDPAAGAPSPLPYGTNSVPRGTRVTNSVALLAQTNGVQYQCRGWRGTGSVPLSGSGTQTVFTVTTNSSLTWQWQPTAYQLRVLLRGSGQVESGSGWYAIRQALTLTPTPAPHYRFDHWSGDVPAAMTNANPLTLAMDQPRNVTAVFVAFESAGRLAWQFGLGNLSGGIYSPDGQSVLTYGGHGAVLWSAADGSVVRTFTDHAARVTSAAFSADGRQLLTGSEDKTAKLWSVADGTVIQTLYGHAWGVLSVAMSPDGAQAVTGGGDWSARLWSLSSGTLIRSWREHTGAVNAVAFSPDGRYVMTGSDDQTLKLWSVTGETSVRTFSGHAHAVSCLAFSPDGTRIVTGSWDRTARLWSVADGAALQVFEPHADIVTSVDYSADGKRVLTGGADNQARLWSVADGTLVTNYLGHTDKIDSVRFAPSGHQLLTASHDQTVRLWSLADGSVARTLEGHSGRILSVAFSADASQILTAGDDKTARAWSLSDGGLRHTFAGHGGIVHGVAISRDAERVFTGSEDRTAKLWSTTNGAVLATLSGDLGVVNCVAFTPDERFVFTGTGMYSRMGSRWSAKGSLLQRYYSTTSPTGSAVTSAAYSPTDSAVLIGYADMTAQLNQGGQIFSGHTNAVSSVAFSPDGSQVLTGSYDQTARLWSLAGAVLRTFAGHGALVSSVAFSPDGALVVTGGGDGTAKIWSADTGTLLQTLRGHLDEVKSVAFSPDGHWLLTGGLDGVAMLWRMTDVPAAPPLSVTAPAWQTNGFRLSIQGAAGSAVTIQASTDLITWQTLRDLPLLTGTNSWLDLEGYLYPQRFYRIQTGNRQ